MTELRGNGLKGHLPPQLAFLSYLQVFSAGHNHLMGGNIMINGSSSPLHSIDVAFARLSTLRALTLHGNNYTGSLPLQVLRDNSQLELLLLAENQFRGTLPSELAALTRLGELQLPWNNMTGSIPTSLAKLNKTLSKSEFRGCRAGYAHASHPLYVRSCRNHQLGWESTHRDTAHRNYTVDATQNSHSVQQFRVVRVLGYGPTGNVQPARFPGCLYTIEWDISKTTLFQIDSIDKL